jgi:hypothetical protein
MTATCSLNRISLALLLMAMVFSSATADALVERHTQADPPLAGEMPIGQAVDQLSDRLHARVVILGELPLRQVRLDLSLRSALDNLKSILKGCSYAIIYNDPSHSHSSLLHTPRIDTSMPSHAAVIEPDQSDPAVPRKRLTARIEQLEKQIESGEADRFFDHWSKHKDPKYIYNHRADLDRLKKRLSHIDEEK